MPTPQTTFRLSDFDKARLDAIAESTGDTRAGALRTGLAAALQNEGLLAAVRAANTARAFLARLTDVYGQHAVLHVEVIDDRGAARWELLAGRVGGRDPFAAEVRRQDDANHLDLVDTITGVRIRDAYVTESKSFAVPISAFKVPLPVPPGAAEEKQALPDGSMLVTEYGADGSYTTRAYGGEATTALLHARAELIPEFGS